MFENYATLLCVRYILCGADMDASFLERGRPPDLSIPAPLSLQRGQAGLLPTPPDSAYSETNNFDQLAGFTDFPNWQYSDRQRGSNLDYGHQFVQQTGRRMPTEVALTEVSNDGFALRGSEHLRMKKLSTDSSATGISSPKQLW